ncbi:MAG: efflux RND transporter periplasmic adaptor subunit [Planctomycetaceae bacterium]
MSNASRLVAGVLVSASLVGPMTRAHEGHEPLPAKGVLVDVEQGTIALSATAHGALMIETADVTTHAVDATITSYARLVPAWHRHAFAATGIGGRVAAMHVRAGDVVAAGQPLARIESLALETIQLELLTARAEHELAARTFERIRALAESQAAAIRERSEARARLEQTQGAVDVAAAKLRSLDVPEAIVAALLADADRPLTSSVEILSPISGTIMHVDVTVGDVVPANEHLFEVVDLGEVWAEISVLERDIQAVAAGQRVELTLPAWPAERLAATIHATGRMLDPDTKLGTAWAALANPAGAPPRFLPGMTGLAAIVSGTGVERTAVPAEALVTNGIEKFVLLEEAATERGYEYRKQNVVVEGADSGMVTLREGAVFPGDRVVTKGSHELAGFFVSGVLRLSPEAEANMGLKTEAVTLHPVDDVLEFDGMVDVPPGARTIAAAQVEGRITRLRGRVGHEVAKGEVLAEVSSVAALDIQLQLIQAAAQRRLADESLQRLQELDATQSVPRRRVWEGQTAALALAERVESLSRTLQGLGFQAAEVGRVAGRGEVLPTLTIRAPASGTVVRLEAVPGQVIQPNEPLAEIHDSRHAWVRGHLTETEVGRLHAHDPAGSARVRFVAAPGRVFEGTVARRGTVIDARDRTLPVWVEIDLPEGDVLQHNMLARVSLPIGRADPTLAVPVSAVARQGTQAYVFVRAADGSFRRQPVALGRSDDRVVTVVSGLDPGDVVAVAGVADLQTAFASIR